MVLDLNRKNVPGAYSLVFDSGNKDFGDILATVHDVWLLNHSASVGCVVGG